MAVKTKSYDRNRFRKVYPRFRPEPNPGFMSDGRVVLEALIVNFNDQDRAVFNLEGRYQNIPSVTVTPLGDINNVNVYISSLKLGSVPASGGKSCQVIIESSTKFTGQVHVQVMETA